MKIMDRKTFIKNTGICIGLAGVPSIVLGQNILNTNLQKSEVTPRNIRDEEGKVFNVLGDLQTHKFSGSDTGNQIVEWVSNVKPGVGIPPHVHTKEDEIFRVIKGQVELTVNGKSTILKAGDTAFAPKNIPHAWKVIGNETAKMIVSAFPAGIEKMFQQLASLPAGPPDFEKVAKICGSHGVSFV
jgi:quercetin dioxygenase-like cupin family protein